MIVKNKNKISTKELYWESIFLIFDSILTKKLNLIILINSNIRGNPQISIFIPMGLILKREVKGVFQ